MWKNWSAQQLINPQASNLKNKIPLVAGIMPDRQRDFDVYTDRTVPRFGKRSAQIKKGLQQTTETLNILWRE
ncbi:MAG: hypothetical protein V6Z89_22345 [Desulfobacter sp.]